MSHPRVSCHIAPLLKQSSYLTEPYWIFGLDGMALDDWLDAEALAHQPFAGLIPALSQARDPAEAQLAWQRSLPLPGRSAKAPLLICPEHRDFSCLVVVAEVVRDEHTVSWRRLGINVASAASPEEIGGTVEWFGIEPLIFDSRAYLACLEHFHLLRISRQLALADKRFALLIQHQNGLGEQSWALLQGHSRLDPAGLSLELPGYSLNVQGAWLPLLRPIEPAQRELFEDAEFCLPLPASHLPAELQQRLGIA